MHGLVLTTFTKRNEKQFSKHHEGSGHVLSPPSALKCWRISKGWFSIIIFAPLLKIMTIHVHYAKNNNWLYIYVTNCLCACIKRNHFASTKQLLLKWIVTICFTFYKLFVVRWFFGVLILLILVHSRLFMFIAWSVQIFSCSLVLIACMCAKMNNVGTWEHRK